MFKLLRWLKWLKHDSHLCIMYVDKRYVLVDTRKNKFDIVE